MLAVVVGATNGIGFYTALGLAKRKVDTLILLGRSAEKGEVIKSACLEEHPACKIHFVVVELSLIANVRVAIKEVKQLAKDGIDILYNSAALCVFEHVQTSERIEQSLVVNYLQRYLFATELLPLLNKIPHSRVVIVAGPKQNWDVPLDIDDLSTTQSKNQGTLVVRIATKCNDVFVSEFTKRLKKENSKTSVYLLNPGVVNTGGTRELAWYYRYMFAFFALIIGTSIEKSGDIPVSLALDEKFKGRNVVCFQNEEVFPPESVTNDELGVNFGLVLNLYATK